MKDILIITNYFPPEKGAASNRIFHLADGLQKKGFKISVVTPLPNYPTGKIFPGFSRSFKKTTVENQIEIIRLWIYASNSKNKFIRLVSMLSYSFSLFWYFIFNKIPKTVIVQSPPLLVAFTSLLFLRSKNRKLILNVSDLWPLAGLELGAFKNNWSYKLLEKIERFNYKNTDLIMGQSQEILDHVGNIFDGKKLIIYRNYPDFKAPISSEYSPGSKLRIVYAGLLGVAQGIYKLCENLDFQKIELHIYGAGAEKSSILDFISKNPDKSIIYHGEVSREDLHSELTTYDLAIIPLLNRIYGSVPSKIFEFTKLGLPLLYFGGGEGENIILKHKLGWTAAAGNYEKLNKVISQIKKEDLSSEFREKIMKEANSEFNFDHQLEGLIPHL